MSEELSNGEQPVELRDGEPETRLDEPTALKQAEALRDNPDFMGAISRRAIAVGQLSELEPQFKEVEAGYREEEGRYLDEVAAADAKITNTMSFQKGNFDALRARREERNRASQGLEEFRNSLPLAGEIDRLRKEKGDAGIAAKIAELKTLYDAKPGWVAIHEKDKRAIYAWNLFSEIHKTNPRIMEMPLGEWMDAAKRYWPIVSDTQHEESMVHRARDVHDGIKMAQAAENGADVEFQEEFSLKVKSPLEMLNRITGLVSNEKAVRSFWDPAMTDDWYENSAVSRDVFDVEGERESFLGSITGETSLDEIYDALASLAERVAGVLDEHAKPFTQKAEEARQELINWHPSEATPETA